MERRETKTLAGPRIGEGRSEEVVARGALEIAAVSEEGAEVATGADGVSVAEASAVGVVTVGAGEGSAAAGVVSAIVTVVAVDGAVVDSGVENVADLGVATVDPGVASKRGTHLVRPARGETKKSLLTIGESARTIRMLILRTVAGMSKL